MIHVKDSSLVAGGGLSDKKIDVLASDVIPNSTSQENVGESMSQDHTISNELFAVTEFPAVEEVDLFKEIEKDLSYDMQGNAISGAVSSVPPAQSVVVKTPSESAGQDGLLVNRPKFNIVDHASKLQMCLF